MDFSTATGDGTQNLFKNVNNCKGDLSTAILHCLASLRILTDQSGGLLPRGNSRLCGTALSGLRIIGNDASLGGKSPTIVEDEDILRAPDWACVTVTHFRLRCRRQ